ncbi:hypothetical protein QFC20_007804 [Naganishia adeliensis]|uniref:Uncharacterized protein n=2 Tax=Naganishia adeliensis TaxID=92952 RepID=A0ACC2UVG2_9TREE|nr:hypothetical protein QFC20_007804 [Naganishia adeliensis]
MSASSVDPNAARTTLDPGPETLMRTRTPSRQRVEEVYDPKYAVDLATTETKENVFLFVPNIIGYSRIVLAAFALFYMPYHPKACTLLYGISCLLDAVDGQAARALGQTSKFGAVLDMVTDRCTTAGLLCYLASAYPSYALLFQFLIALDFASHYIHMYASLLTGSSSHKTVTSDVSRILWYYYNDSRTLFFFCFCNELFYVCLYLNAFYHKPLISPDLSVSALILRGLSVASSPETAWKIATYFHKTSNMLVWFLRQLTWPQVLAILTGPVCFGKNIINCVQFWKASKILVGVDLAEREAARQAQRLKAAGTGKAN